MRSHLRKMPAFAAATVMVLGGCTGSDPKAKPKPSPVVLKADLSQGEVKAVSGNDAPQASQRATEEVPKVLSTLNNFYTVAFVDPKKWSSGTHPELAGLFSAEAQPSLTANLGAMAWADLAPKIKSFKPDKQQLTKVSFFLENDLSAPAAIATVSFEGVGTTKAKADGPVRLVHTATFWLSRDGDAYKISAYSAELKADTTPAKTKKAAFGI